MAKKNSFISANLSFEDFEKTLNQPDLDTHPADELIKNKEASENAAKKKEAELKKAWQKKKRMR